MTGRLRALARSRASIVGIVMGVGYGIVARFLAETKLFGDTFLVMSVAFLFVVPIVIGALTVSGVEAPSWRFRVFAPWIPISLTVAAATAVGWEGAICVFMSLPLLLVLASAGGAFGGSAVARRWGVRPTMAALPFLLGSVEAHVGSPERLVETVTEIRIAAPPAVVWPLVASVDSIRPEEQRPALFTRLGFPRPVSATISGANVGAVRRAEFERGLVFTETVTEWQPGRRLSFTIDPNTETIPPTTLDPHVTIGGRFFDVLDGTYELHPYDGGQGTLLVLRSTHRVSTHFNGYAAWWANRIMASIQANILGLHKDRAERASRHVGVV